MNNDYLRVNSKTEEPDISISEFKAEKKTAVKEEEQKVNLITLLNFSRSKSENAEIRAANLPNLKGLFTIFSISVFITLLLAFFAFFKSDVTILMFTATVASLVFPLFLVMFFYQLNTQKDVSLLEVIISFIVGIGLYLVLGFVETYINEFIYFDWVENIVGLVFKDFVLFVSAGLLVKIAKKDDLYSAMTLSVCIYAGYLFFHSLDSLTNSMFVSVQISNGDRNITTGAIILGDESFKTIISSFLRTMLYEVAFHSLTICSYAVVNGGVIGINVSPVKDENYKEWSIYVLFLITVVLHLGAVFPSTIRTFEIILKSISLVFSVVLAITILNYYLARTHFATKKD